MGIAFCPGCWSQIPPGMRGRTASPPQGLRAEQHPVPRTTTHSVKPRLPVGSPGGCQAPSYCQHLPLFTVVPPPPLSPVPLSPGVVSEPASEMAQAGAVRSDAAGPDSLLHRLRAALAHPC